MEAEVEEDGVGITEDSEGEPGEENPENLLDAQEPLRMGDTVEAHGKTWKRVEGLEEDARTETEVASKFSRLHYNESTREIDIFWQLMPLSKDKLLEIVREGSQRVEDKRTWKVEHIEAALCIIFGGAQYKAGTNLWSTEKKGMLTAPDFGMHLSQDKFQKILRYWSYGPDGTKKKLRDNPWEEVYIWIRGFNKNRQAEIEAGTDITPDEMMFEWTGQAGAGGIPHKSFIERKLKPFGSELKSVVKGPSETACILSCKRGRSECNAKNGALNTRRLQLVRFAWLTE